MSSPTTKDTHWSGESLKLTPVYAAYRPIPVFNRQNHKGMDKRLGEGQILTKNQRRRKAGVNILPQLRMQQPGGNLRHPKPQWCMSFTGGTPNAIAHALNGNIVAQCATGGVTGGVSVRMLAEGRQALRDLRGHQLVPIVGDGSCFYHAISRASEGDTGVPAWTMAELRTMVGQEQLAVWAEEADITQLARLLSLRLVVVPCELYASPVELRYDLTMEFGPPDGAVVRLVWWNVMGRGLHFDLLQQPDQLERYSYDQLRRLCTTNGIPVLEHYRAIHLRSALRRRNTALAPSVTIDLTDDAPGPERAIPVQLTAQQRAQIDANRKKALAKKAAKQPFQLAPTTAAHMPPPALPSPIMFTGQEFMASPCTLLSDRNPHSRDSRLKFTAATHTYHIDGVPTLGSVTGLIHSFGRPFVEDDVINGMVAGRNWPRVGYLRRPTPPQLELILDSLDTEEARDLRHKLRSDVEEDDLVLAVRLCIARHPDQKDRMLPMLALSPTEIKDKWEQLRVEAACRGTWMHLQFEMYLNRMPSDIRTKEGRLFMRFLEQMNGHVAFRTEWQIYDSDRRLAGSIDFVARRWDGTLVLVDWKRSKDLAAKYESRFGYMQGELRHIPDAQGHHYRLQLNLYKHMLESHYGYVVSEMLVVCCHPQLEEPFVDVVPDMPDEVQALLAHQEARVRSGDTNPPHAAPAAVHGAPHQIVEVRMPNQPRRLLSCPCENAAINMYEWVSAQYNLVPGSFTITWNGVPLWKNWCPRGRVTLRVTMKQSIRGTLGRCSMIRRDAHRGEKRRRSMDMGMDEVPPAKRRRTARYIRMLLDSGADAHICSSTFTLGSTTANIDDEAEEVVDAQGNRLVSTGVRRVRLLVNGQPLVINMRECPSTDTPILSMGSLLRDGMSFYSVRHEGSDQDTRGPVVAGLQHSAGCIPVHCEDDHLWVYLNDNGSLPTAELQRTTSAARVEGYSTDVQILLDSGSDTHICPRDFKPPGSMDEAIPDGAARVGIDAQGNQVAMETLRKVCLRAGHVRMDVKFMVAERIHDLIFSLTRMLQSGITITLQGLGEEDDALNTKEVGVISVEDLGLPVFLCGGSIWMMAHSGQPWPAEHGTDHRLSMISRDDEMSSAVDVVLADEVAMKAEPESTQRDVPESQCHRIKEEPVDNKVVATEQLVDLVELARLRKRHKSTASSAASFATMFNKCIRHGAPISAWPEDLDTSGYNILSTARALRDETKKVFPGADDRLTRLLAVALQASQLRLQDYSIREHILLVWLVEGEVSIRSHGGSVFIYHEDGAFQEYRHAVTPESTLGRVKHALMVVEGMYRLMSTPNMNRDSATVLAALKSLSDNYADNQSLYEACRAAALKAVPSMTSKRSTKRDHDVFDVLEGEAVTDNAEPWTIRVANAVLKVSQQLMEKLLNDRFFTYICEWCECARSQTPGVAYTNRSVKFHEGVQGDGAYATYLPRSSGNDLYIRIPHPLTDAVAEDALQRLLNYYTTSFWSIPDVFECGQAAQALCKRGINVDRLFIGLSPGGVGQSLFTSHIAAVYGDNHHLYDPNIWCNEEEMRKQVEGIAGAIIFTGQEAPDSTKPLKEDLF